MKITQDVRDYAAKIGMEEQAALTAGMKEKAEEFKRLGGEIYGEVASYTAGSSDTLMQAAPGMRKATDILDGGQYLIFRQSRLRHTLHGGVGFRLEADRGCEQRVAGRGLL